MVHGQQHADDADNEEPAYKPRMQKPHMTAVEDNTIKRDVMDMFKRLFTGSAKRVGQQLLRHGMPHDQIEKEIRHRIAFTQDEKDELVGYVLMLRPSPSSLTQIFLAICYTLAGQGLANVGPRMWRVRECIPESLSLSQHGFSKKALTQGLKQLAASANSFVLMKPATSFPPTSSALCG